MQTMRGIMLRAFTGAAGIALLGGGAAPSGCSDTASPTPPAAAMQSNTALTGATGQAVTAPGATQPTPGAAAANAMAPDPGVKRAPPGNGVWEVRQPAAPDAKAGDIYWAQHRSDAPPGANGWTVIYVSEITEGVKIYVSGEIYVPAKPAAGQRDVVLWNHETSGVADACAPSRRDFVEDGHERAPGVTELLGRGYVVAMSDYPGQGLPGPAFYMVGRVNARASLDLLKAVQNFPIAAASKRFVMYGWSQGGQTTMWAESIAQAYAPGFTGLGAGLIAPAVRILKLTMRSMTDKTLAGYVISTLPGIHAAYPMLKYGDFLTTEGLEQFPAMADGCFDVWSSAASVQNPYQANALAPQSAWWTAMTEVDNFKPAGSMPFVVFQGTADTTTPPEFTADEVAALCQSGVDVEARSFMGADHVGVVPAAATMFPAWADDRFNGRKTTSTCGMK